MRVCVHCVQCSRAVHRDSELARIPRELLFLLKEKYSNTVTTRLLELLTERLARSHIAAGLAGARTVDGADAAMPMILMMPQLLGSPTDYHSMPLASPLPVRAASTQRSFFEDRCDNANGNGGALEEPVAGAGPSCQFRTVAVLALSDDVPLASVALELQFALSPMCTSLRLTSEIILQRLGTRFDCHCTRTRNCSLSYI